MSDLRNLFQRKVTLATFSAKITDRRNDVSFVGQMTEVIKKHETIADLSVRLAEKANVLGYDFCIVFDSEPTFREVTFFPEDLLKKEVENDD